MRRIFFLLMLACLATACKDKNSFTVNGTIKGKTQKFIYLNKLDVTNPVLIDSAKISKKGSFRFTVKATGPDFYQLGFSTSDFITLLAERGEQIKLSFSSNNLYDNYNVEGSEGTSKLQVLDVTLASTKRKLDSLTALYNKLSKEPGFDVRGPELESQFTSIIKEQRKKNIEFIINNINSLAAIKALYQNITPDTYVLYEPNDLQYLKIVTDSLSRHYPNSKQVQALASDLSTQLNKMYVERLGSIASKLPEAKLNPDLMNIEGRRISLASLKGKYVLLTFWSFRSKECLVENLQLKEYYKIYKNKGLEIYQINVDDSETDWRRAVKYDELPWISTREDDPKNPVNARLFNVTRLPSNFLFDKDGNIIGSNLHDRVLQIKLEQLFSK